MLSCDSSDDDLSTLLIVILFVEFPESRLDFFVVRLDSRERLLDACEAHSSIWLRRAVEVLLLAVSLNLFATVSDLYQPQCRGGAFEEMSEL